MSNETLINRSIENSIPNMDIKVDTLPDMNDLLQFKNSLIEGINQFLKTFSPEYITVIVLIISAVIALLLKRKYEEDWLWFGIVTIVIYGFLIWIGIGK